MKTAIIAWNGSMEYEFKLVSILVAYFFTFNFLCCSLSNRSKRPWHYCQLTLIWYVRFYTMNFTNWSWSTSFIQLYSIISTHWFTCCTVGSNLLFTGCITYLILLNSFFTTHHSVLWYENLLLKTVMWFTENLWSYNLFFFC